MNSHPSPLPPYEPAPRTDRQLEPAELKYPRQTRNAAVFIAWVVGIIAIAGLAWGIFLGIRVSQLQAELNTGNGVSTSSTSNCTPGSAIPGC